MADSPDALRQRIAELEAELEKARAGAAAAAWDRLKSQYPERITDDSPNGDVVARAVDIFAELMSHMERIDQQVGSFLREMRGHSEQFDLLNDLFQQNPKVADATRDFLLTGGRRGAFRNSLRSRISLLCACASGMHKAIIESHLKLHDEMNYRNWKDLPPKSSDAAIGKYAREQLGSLADALATDLRRRAAERINEDYDSMA